MKRWMGVAMALCALAATTSCIDEDLDDCPTKLRIDYTMRLRTNIDTEVTTELTTADEVAMGGQLRAALSNVFTDHASDVDLSFFTAGALSHEESHTLNASQGTFTITIPAQQYRHLALANVGQEPLVSVESPSELSALSIKQQQADIIDSHSAGLFTARLDMDVEGRSQEFHTDLYMVNAAAALVIDLNGMQPDDIQGYVCGMATSFAVNDSTYAFDNSPKVRTKALSTSKLHALYAACMPSQNPTTTTGTRADATGLWQMKVYVKLNGKTTETILSVADPLRAGNLKILKGKLDSNGGISSQTQNVGASVTLDWKDGGSHDITI